MSIYDYALNSNQILPSSNLQQFGPLILVEIAPPDSLVQVLVDSKIPIPPSITGWGTIDTGAYTTCINKTILKSLGGQPVGTRSVLTPGANVDLDLYPAKITFPGTMINRAYEEALGIEDMSHSQYENIPIIGLIGRDVLADCLFIYNGKTGIYTLTQ